ncbi:MAG: DUF4923 family protein [Alistipes sp.]|nr:DUF4923 family protein [Alistipes sp.]
MRILIFTLTLLLGAQQLTAQSWSDLLKKTATEAVDKLTGGQLTEHAINATWNYTEPAVRLESSNALSEVGSLAIESTVTPKLTTAYSIVGIKSGAASFIFNEGKSFTANLGRAKNLSGSYTFDPTSHTITLNFASGRFKLGKISGKAYISGSELQLVFPVTKLVDLVTTLGSSIGSLKTIATLLERYDEAYLGFAFTKQ